MKKGKHAVSEWEFLRSRATEETPAEETVEASEGEQTPEKKEPLWRQVWWFLRPTVIACVIVLIVTQFLIMYAVVPTGSMEHTIPTGSYILANRRAYDSDSPQRGDVVLFETDQSQEKYLVKRVIGVEGDVIELRDGAVYLNGALCEEAYVTSPTYPSVIPDGLERTRYEIPEDCVFVMGDNRAFSLDARQWENPYLPVKNICGEVVCVFSVKQWFFRTL